MAQTNIITYQRVLNLGNYETKRLEMSVQLDELDDVETETRALIKTVEILIRGGEEDELKAEISQLQAQHDYLFEANTRLSKEIERKQEQLEQEVF